MSNYRFHRNGVMGLVLMTVTPFLFAANNPVSVETRESQTDIRPAASTLPYQPPIEDEFSNSLGGGQEQYQVQLLQQEVQELRGLVEELRFQLDQMRTTQNDRYLELDARVLQLSTQAVVDSTQSAASESVDTQANASQSTIEAATGEQDEKTLYNNAVGLIRTRQYDLAISQLEAQIAQYPQGQFAANAYYWLGEVHAAKPSPDYTAARQALAQVITFFPDSRKVPDAAFKLGKVYHLTGDCDRAIELLQQVSTEHEGKTVARLAQDYLRDRMGSCRTP